MDASLGELLPRLALSMAVVIGAMAIAARLLKNRQMPGSGALRLNTPVAAKRNPIEVIARQGVGRHAVVTIVRTGDKTLVLGVTEGSISVLTELDEVALADNQVDVHGTDVDIDAAVQLAAANPSWKGLLTQVRESTVRR